MRAVAREAAFEQDEGVDLERVGGEAPSALEEGRDLAGAAAFPAGECDVGHEGAALGLEAGGLAGTLDLGGERGERRLGLDAGPQRARIALLEAGGAMDARLERLRADCGQRGGEVFADRAVDLADEAQA